MKDTPDGTAKAVRVRFYVGEADHWENAPLYLRLLERLRAEGCAGATVTRGIAGFGVGGRLHTANIVDLSADLPIVVDWVDAPQRVARLLPSLRAMLSSGLITVEEVDAIWLRPRKVDPIGSERRVSDVMTRQVLTVRPEAPLAEAVDILLKGRQRALPVVDAERRVVGIITNGDLVERGGLRVRVEVLGSLGQGMLENVLADLEEGHTVGQVMTTDVVTVGPDTPLDEAAHLMVGRGVKRLPVVDAAGVLLGIVSRLDLLRAHAEAGVEAAPEGAPTTGRTVGEVMQKKVPVVGRSAPLADLLDAVVSTRLNRAVVVDEERRVVGIVSDAELTRRLSAKDRPGAVRVLMSRVPFANLSAEERRDLERATGGTAEALMVSDVATVTPETSLPAAIAVMLRGRQKVLPVVDADGRLLGAVDRADLLRLAAGGGAE